MPITKSAKKALRQSARKKTQNRAKKSKVKDLKKKILSLVKEQKKEEASALLSEFSKAADKAAKTGALNRNKASREKSRISSLVKKN